MQLHSKETLTPVLSCEYCKIFKNSFFYRTSPVAALHYVIYCVKGSWKANKNTQSIQVTIKSFKYLMISWIIEWPVEWLTWKTRLFGLKILLTRRYLGKWWNVIRSSILEKHGNTDIGVKYPYSERTPPLKTGVTRKIFKSPGKISISGDKSNINFKETNSSPNHFLTTLKLILLQH